MKLRIKGDSLRLRLTQGEVTQLDTGGVVEEKTRFVGGAALIYRLRRDSAVNSLSASFAQGAVEIRVPEKSVRAWASSNDEAIAGTQSLSEGDELRISVEKDFRCLAPREGEDESDNFANPTVGKTC
jgi:hypothetical protein